MPRTGRPKSPDPRVLMSFRLSGPVARMLQTVPDGHRSEVVEASIREAVGKEMQVRIDDEWHTLKIEEG